MTTKVFCDVCGKEVPTVASGDCFGFVRGILLKNYDLCEDCAKEVKEFIEERIYQIREDA